MEEKNRNFQNSTRFVLYMSICVNGMNFNGRKLHVPLFNYYCILQTIHSCSERNGWWQCPTFDSIPSFVFIHFRFSFTFIILFSFYIIERRTSSTLTRTHMHAYETDSTLLPFIITFISNQNNEKLREAVLLLYIKLWIPFLGIKYEILCVLNGDCRMHRIGMFKCSMFNKASIHLAARQFHIYFCRFTTRKWNSNNNKLKLHQPHFISF